MNKCKALKKDGKPCKGLALEDGYCFAHSRPAEPEPVSKTIKVMAIAWYHNGMIPGATEWKNEEVREVDANTYRLLREDAPRNWRVVDA